MEQGAAVDSLVVKVPSSEVRGTSVAIRDDSSATWIRGIRHYLAAIAIGSLVWEVAQLPLYTIWHEETPRGIAFAALHCTAGDILIATASLVGALVFFGNMRWPANGYRRVAAVAIAGGLAYTVLSEWLHVEIRGSWTYAESMPRLPITGTGLSPFAQWLAVPIISFWWTYRRVGNSAAEKGCERRK